MAGGSHPPPAPTEPSVQISHDLWEQKFVGWSQIENPDQIDLVNMRSVVEQQRELNLLLAQIDDCRHLAVPPSFRALRSVGGRYLPNVVWVTWLPDRQSSDRSRP